MATPRKPGRAREVEVPDEIEGGFVIGEEIGRGSFATVYRGWRKGAPHHQVAIKAVVRSKLTTKLFQNLQDEINILKRIRHGNVVGLVECVSSEHFIYLVMQYCGMGDLSMYIKQKGSAAAAAAAGKNAEAQEGREAREEKERMYKQVEDKFPHPKDGGLNEWVARSFVGQLADALSFLRSHSIIHRDIKPQNLLLHNSPAHARSYSPTSSAALAASLSEGDGFAFGTPPPGVTFLAGTASQMAEARYVPEGIPILRVADFGFARVLAPNAGLAETLCGSPLYMAPEILRYEKYDAKADLWSVGAVLYEMCTGKPPFRAQNHVELLRRIEKTEDRIVFPDERPPKEGEPVKEVHKVPDDVKALIRNLLKRNPVERMSFSDFFAQAKEVADQGLLKRPGQSRRPTNPAGMSPGSNNALPSPPTSSEELRPRPPSTTSLPTVFTASSSRPAPLPKPRPAAPVAAAALANVTGAFHKGAEPGAFLNRPMAPCLTRQGSDDQRPGCVTQRSPAQLQQVAAAAAMAKPRNHSPARKWSADKVPLHPHHPMVNLGQGAPSPSALPSPLPLKHQPSFPAKYVVGVGHSSSNGSSSSGVTIRGDGSGIHATEQGVKAREYSTAMPRMGYEAATLNRRPSGHSVKATPPAPLPIPLPGPPPAVPLPSVLAKGYDREEKLERRESDDDSALGREYVVVEKRAVEINALVDDLAQSPRKPVSLTRRMSRGFMARPSLPSLNSHAHTSPSGQANVHPSPQLRNSPSPPVPATNGPVGQPGAFFPPRPADAPSPPPYNYGVNGRERPSPSSMAQPGTSPLNHEIGKYIGSPRVGNFPSSALAKALTSAGTKMFGPTSNDVVRRAPQRSPSQRAASLDPVDVKLILDLEDYANKALVILHFADEKLTNLLPPTPANATPLQLPPTPSTLHHPQLGAFLPAGMITNMKRTPSSSNEAINGSNRADVVAAEAMALYIKALNFLDRAIRHAAETTQWKKDRGMPQAQTSLPVAEAMEWMRARFNEALDKTELARKKAGDSLSDCSAPADKLIYDRALDMSRSAAAKELMNESAADCELEYETALWMLGAILDPVMHEGDESPDDDSEMVEKFICSIRVRLSALRRKMAGRV